MLTPRHTLTSVFALLSLLATGFTDTVITKSGEKIEGRILNENDTQLTIEVTMGTIKDERLVKKADIERIDKIQPDVEAWAPLQNLALGEESLETQDYQRAIMMLNGFVSQFPQSPRAAEAKTKLQAFQDELKRVDTGEMKLSGKWLTPEEVAEERVQITGRALFGRMKRHAAAGQLIEAMNAFDSLQKNALGSASFPDAVILARQILPTLKAAADRARADLKNQDAERKRRLGNVQGAERAQLEAMQKQQVAQTEAAVQRYQRSGVKWMPLSPATDMSLQTISTKAAAEVATLNQHNVQQMKNSIASTDQAKAALETGDLVSAEKAVQEATSAWARNEYVTRLQPKIAELKTKSADQLKTEAAARAAEEKAAATGKAAAKPKPAAEPATPAPVMASVPEPQPSLLARPIFWVILAAVLGFGLLGMKALAKFRDPEKNILDQ